jgi:polyisoprenoid-binding protein YceI
VEVVGEDPASSTVRLAFDSRQLAIVPGSEPASDAPSVAARMRGPEVLDVEHFQRIAFVSTSVVAEPRSAGRPLRLRVHGSLELKGRRFEVDVPVEVKRDGAGLTATGEAFLELRALGIEPPSVGGVVKVANRFRLAFELLARP